MLGYTQERWNKIASEHWWLRGNHAIAKNIISQYVKNNRLEGDRYIDIGCSGGDISRYLSTYGKVVGIDISYEGVRLCNSKSVYALNASATRIPFKHGTFAMATLFDVAEHVDDDKALFREINSMLSPRGILLMTVPAYMCLWGSHDVLYGHKRRYKKKDIIKLAMDSGFKILRLSYMHLPFLPFMAIARFFDRKTKTNYGKQDDFRSFGFLMDSFFLGLLILESRILKYINFPTGTSLLCVMKKI